MFRLCPCLSLMTILTLALSSASAQDEIDPEPAPKKPAEPRTPLPEKVVAELAGLRRTDTVHVLGDAAMTVWLTKTFRINCVGYDDADGVKRARELAKKENVEVKLDTLKFDKLDLKGANVVLVNLDRKQHAKLVPLLRKLPDGTRIVTAETLAGVKGGKSYEYTTTKDVTTKVFRVERRQMGDKIVEVKVPVLVTERRAIKAMVTAYKTPLEKSE